GEKYLRDQLQSILDQTRPPDEIVISDDGSTDSTLEIIEEFASSSGGPQPPVWRVETRAKPLGVSGNFASALAKARWEFIALADQDDVWEPERLEKGLSHFHDGVLLVHSDATLIDASGRPTGTLMSALRLTSTERRNLLSGRALDALLRRNVVTGATTMIRSSLLEHALPIPEGWVHDEWLALVAAAQGGVVYHQDPLIRYRQHGNNEIGASKTDYDEATRRLLEKRSEFFARKLRRNRGIAALLEDKPAWLDSVAHSSLAAKIEFDQWRSTLSSSRVKRLVPVLRRWFTGHYGRYARGYLDVIRDIALTD
ncbi:MAG: glycosyltransferase family 2 protein, partial [Pontimonas sp.]|nr:glycosyltransferase family 2 protein [Pontimonas sp.]